MGHNKLLSTDLLLISYFGVRGRLAGYYVNCSTMHLSTHSGRYFGLNNTSVSLNDHQFDSGNDSHLSSNDGMGISRHSPIDKFVLSTNPFPLSD